jgi:hypothetical protein
MGENLFFERMISGYNRVGEVWEDLMIEEALSPFFMLLFLCSSSGGCFKSFFFTSTIFGLFFVVFFKHVNYG